MDYAARPDAEKSAVVLLSGGLDSTTAAAVALAEGFRVHALSFNYGQRHKVELESASRVAESLKLADHKVIDIDLRAFGGSALTADIAVPKSRDSAQMSRDIPVTYVPARNTIFLSFALAWCEVLNSTDIFVGMNALDYSGYPDCRPEFVSAYEQMARLATKTGIEGGPLTIHAPLMHMSKGDIVRTGLALGLDYGMTSSCYDPATSGQPCGLCDSCQLRAKGFAEAGAADPLLSRYRS